jgi:hypothetical protein
VRIYYACKAVDENNPTVATQVRWIRELAERPQVHHVRVLTRSLGSATLPDNVTVTTFGHGTWPGTILEFWPCPARTWISTSWPRAVHTRPPASHQAVPGPGALPVEGPRARVNPDAILCPLLR